MSLEFHDTGIVSRPILRGYPMKTDLSGNVRRLRKAAQLTQAQLADAAGLPRATVAALEQPEANPGLQVLLAVARALGVSLDDLVSPPPAHRYYKVPLSERRENCSPDGAFRATMVSPIASRGVQIQNVEMDPGCKYHGQPHPFGSQEFFVVQEGTATLVIDGEAVTLAAGDLVQFPGQLPHTYRNLDPRQGVKALSVVVLSI
ncbi:MAG: XRE family transcriptional regulator [Planctomycetota bacterium]|nr:MAG: XRE family transcriptional regulator [Planctomycetota bacterium]